MDVVVITQELEGHGEERLEVLEQLEEDDGEEVGPQEGLHEGLAGRGGKGGQPGNPGPAAEAACEAPEAAEAADAVDAAGGIGGGGESANHP